MITSKDPETVVPEVDIHKTFRDAMASQAAMLADASAMSPTGIGITIQLGQLHHLIQTVEVTFVQYQEMRCDPTFDPEGGDDFEYSDILDHPFRELSRRISHLRDIDPTDPLLPVMDLFKNFRGWVAHKMTATFAPALYNEQLAVGLAPLVLKMLEYATYASQRVGQACIEWMTTHIPPTHENFTEQSVRDFNEALSYKTSQIIPNQIVLPTGVTCALKQSGFWPYDVAPGNNGIVLGLTDDGKLGAAPL
jgi:hypothetical protein